MTVDPSKLMLLVAEVGVVGEGGVAVEEGEGVAVSVNELN